MIQLTACVALAASGCGKLTDPPLPASAVRVTPPPVYTRWWAMTEACSGLSGRLDRVNWYVVPNGSDLDARGPAVTGYWSAGSNQIVLSAIVQFSGADVRHEMLHALVRRGGHSREMFVDRCGGVVACSGCVEGGIDTRPDPASVAMTADSLEVGMEMSPADPSGETGDGFVTLTVTARNPAPHPVTITYPVPGMRSFFLEVEGAGENHVRGVSSASRPLLNRFAAGETKRHVFEFRMLADGPGEGLGPGAYIMRGGFGRKFVRIDVVLR